MHADGVAAEAPPVGELLGFDDDVAEVDVAEHRWARSWSRIIDSCQEGGDELVEQVGAFPLHPVAGVDVMSKLGVGHRLTSIGPPLGG